MKLYLCLLSASVIWIIQTEGQHEYIGCYKDPSSDRVWPGPLPWYQSLTIERCTEICRRESHVFAGVEYGGECWCGDTFPDKGKADENECKQKCNGDQSQICGAGNRMNVYTVCTNGTYKSSNTSCANRCGNCRNEDYCHQITGHCLNGCKTNYKRDLCRECVDGFYGQGCMNMCSRNCRNNNVCNKVTGACPNGCNDGLQGDNCTTACKSGNYGQSCRATCSAYCDNVCNHVDGTCGCKPGWNGSKCTTKCGQGRYGQDCALVCSGNCLNDDVCDHKTGECPNGCKPGWEGDTCNKVCNDGHFGADCGKKCSDNCNDVCNKEDGSCHCKPGWREDNCTVECSQGRYGQDCALECSGNCLNDDVCDHVAGECPNGCKVGWEGAGCNMECPNGYYGQLCNTTCGECLGDRTCYSTNGTCIQGCKPGYQGDLCETICNKGTFGEACKGQCQCEQEDDICDHIHGTCENFGNNKGHAGAIGGSIGGLISVIVAVSLVMILILRRRRNSKKEDPVLHRDALMDLRAQAHQNECAYVNLDKNEQEKKTTSPTVVQQPKVNECHSNLQNKVSEKRNIMTTPTAEKQSVQPKPVLPVKPFSATITPSGGACSAKSVPLKIAEVGGYIKEQKKKKNAFEDEFLDLPSDQSAPWLAATCPQNAKAKNRYRNIYAYDHSRVHLKTAPSGQYSDYINANYINGYRSMNKFVATQGPKRTSDDFWTMVWEQNVTRVVMVTNLREGNNDKCEQYWPDLEQDKTFGNFTVSNEKEQEMPGFVVRTLKVKKDLGNSDAIYNNSEDSQRTVLQFHFTEWPDKGVPRHGSAILNFVRKIKKESDKLNAPVVVHCSAGIGRTGTFIALDYLLDQAKAEKMIDVFSCVKAMREHRLKMVQTLEQYIFIYDTMYEAVMVGDTSIQCFEFGKMYSSMKTVDKDTGTSRLEEQYKMLKTIATEQLQERNTTAALKPENINKNRSQTVLPDDSHRMFLITPLPDRNEYINAVFTKSHNKSNAVVLTQLPLVDTVVDFWRMVYDYKIATIAMLTNYKDQESKDICYWPSKNETVEAGPFTIKRKNMKCTGTILCCHLVLEYKKESREIFLGGTVDWPEDKWKPNNENTFYDLFTKIQTWQQKQKEPGKMVIQCLDGGMKSGMYAVVSWMFDMINAEQAVDIFQITKQVVTVRPEFLIKKEQYQDIYKIAEDYMKNFQTYSNFK